MFLHSLSLCHPPTPHHWTYTINCLWQAAPQCSHTLSLPPSQTASLDNTMQAGERTVRSPDYYITSPPGSAKKILTYEISEFLNFDDYCEFLTSNNRKSMVQNGKVCMVEFMRDVVPVPTSSSIADGYGAWMRPGCADCCSTLQQSDLLDLTKSVNWTAIRQGHRDRSRPDNYVPVGTSGVTIYACATFEQEEAACHYISANGPPALPSQSIYLFSTSTLPISAGELLEAFTRANISCVGIFVYGMKAKR